MNWNVYLFIDKTSEARNTLLTDCQLLNRQSSDEQLTTDILICPRSGSHAQVSIHK